MEGGEDLGGSDVMFVAVAFAVQPDMGPLMAWPLRGCR
jgi:hypothetical protein